MKKILCILMVIPLLLLSGCVPVAIVAGVALGGVGTAVVVDKRSFHAMKDDHAAQSYAQRWINQDRLLRGKTHITVIVFNGTALLVGQAPTPALRERAYKIVHRTKHIGKIYNEIIIAAPNSSISRGSDTWLTTKVRTILVKKTGLESNNLKVITEDGVVYLMGNLTHKQAKLATEVARRIAGVKKVVKVFQYTDY